MRFFFLVTGTRDLGPNDIGMVVDVLNDCWSEANSKNFKTNEMALIHGNCRGVDLAAAEWAGSTGVQPIAVPAMWDYYGNSAGYARNRAMVDVIRSLTNSALGPITSNHMCLAFPRGESKGTRGCIELIHKAGLNLRVHEI